MCLFCSFQYHVFHNTSHKHHLLIVTSQIWSLTFERAEELRRQKSDKADEVEKLEATTPQAIWLSDLDAIDEALDERDVDNAAELKREAQAQKKNTARNAKKATAAKKKALKSKKKKKKEKKMMNSCNNRNKTYSRVVKQKAITRISVRNAIRTFCPDTNINCISLGRAERSRKRAR